MFKTGIRNCDVFYISGTWVIEVAVFPNDPDLKRKKISGYHPTKPTKRQLRDFYKRSKVYWDDTPR